MGGVVTSAVIRILYRETSPADAVARRVVAHGAVGKVAVVAAHLAPGVAAYLLLHHAREALSRVLQIDQATVQVGLIMTSIMIGMGAAAVVAPWLIDRLPRRDVIALLGLTRVDPLGLLLAFPLAGAVLVAPTERLYENAFSAWLQDGWLGLPPWHFQRTAAFTEISPWVAAVALLANILGEELWFRAYLYPKLTFLRGWTWPMAALLFIAYHVFEAPVAGFPRWPGPDRLVRAAARPVVMRDAARAAPGSPVGPPVRTGWSFGPRLSGLQPVREPEASGPVGRSRTSSLPSEASQPRRLSTSDGSQLVAVRLARTMMLA